MIRNITKLRILPLFSARTPNIVKLPHSHANIPFRGTAWSNPAWTSLTRNAFSFSDQKDNRNNDEEKRKKELEEESKENKPKLSWKQRLDDFIDNFWEKPDPKNPNKKPTPKSIQLAKKFELMVQYLLAQLKAVYYRRFRVSTLALWLIGAYCIYKLLRSENELTPQAFMELLKMSSF